MLRPLLAAALLLFGVSAQAQEPRAGLRAGLASASFSDDGDRSSSVSPAFSLFLEGMATERIGLGLDLGYLSGERETSRTPLFPFEPGTVSLDYLTVTPTVFYTLPGGTLQPRIYAGPVAGVRLLETISQETANGGRPVRTYSSRGLTYGATAGIGVAVPVGAGAVRDIRLDLEATFVDVASDVSMVATGLRVGVAIAPPPRRR